MGRETWEKPKLVEKNCITCDLGDKPLSNNKVCWDCLTKGKSKWRKKKKRRKRV